MKKKILTILSIIITVTFLVCSFSACGEIPDTSSSAKQSGGEKAVASIAVKTEPTKTEYYVDETLSLEGGVITVTYNDNTTAEMDMTDASFTIGNVNMSMAGTKTITVKLGAKKATFKINVRIKGASAIFDYNYEGAPAPTSVNIVSGFPPQRPTDPVRDGYTFVDWYVDKNCTVKYDFYKVVKDDVTIYAQWKQNGATYYNVNYNMNYYGCSVGTYSQIVKDGEKARMVAITPERVDYVFGGWFTDEACTAQFDVNTAIHAEKNVYAKWTKTKTGTSVYVFEAENTDLSDKKGPGYSGENAGFGMAVEDELNLGASNGKYVSYMYKYGNSLEFYVASDADVANVTLSVRFAAEYNNIVLTPDMYEISVNGVALTYSTISLKLNEGKEVGSFNDYVISTTVNLKKGENLIQLKTINNTAIGPTLFSTAPVIDCIKITTEAVVIWDGTHGLPAGL